MAFPIVRHATTDGPTATFGAPAAQAAELLETAAEITPKDPPVAPGQYWEVTTVARDAAYMNADGTFRMVKERRVDYVSVDASRPTVTTSVTLEKDAGVPATSAHDRDVRAWRFDLPPSQIPGNWSEPNMAFLEGLPRDPAALRTRLYADSAPLGLTPDGNAMQFATELLRSGIVPADLRASVFRVIKTIPGVEVRAHQATVDGRTGVAIGRVEPRNGISTEIVVDPTNGTVIGERSVVDTRMEGWPAAGTVVWDAGVTRRVVDGVPADVRARVVCEVDDFPGRTQPSRC